MQTKHKLLILYVALFTTISVAGNTDWPTWRYDPGRTSSSPADLPDELHLQWRRELGRIETAWPLEPRMQFDQCFKPVAAGKSLFIGSPNDGSIAAYDTETGALRWRFYTDAPVRFAPVVWQGKVYAASDDGRVYCLDADTGNEKWKFRAAPGDRPDLRHLGNGRLVSAWPVRGGPVIADGILYFGSGLWPIIGTFVYALDAETGEEIWVNDRLHYMTNIRTDHNHIADSALSPQGYFVLAGGKLFAPNGRSMPVGIDPENGDLLHFVQGYRNGHCRVTAQGEYVYVGPNGVLDINNGREVGSRWHEGHEETPAGYGRRDLLETPIFPYKFAPAPDAWSALENSIAYGGDSGVFYAHDTSRAEKTTYERGDFNPGKWDVPQLWTLETQYKANDTDSKTIIKAGRRLYGHSDNILVAIDIPPYSGAEPNIAWEKKLPDTPMNMIAADNKLFVVTENGLLLCFGGEQKEPVVHTPIHADLADKDDEWKLRAEKILAATNIKAGYCIVPGIDEGRLVEELLRQSQLKIIAIEDDKDKVEKLRNRLVAAGIYGNRAEVITGNPFELPLPPYIAGLIVSETYNAGKITTGPSAAAIVKLLRPYGGTACFDMHPDDKDKFAAWSAESDLENAGHSSTEHFALLQRTGALPGSAYWTHEAADAAVTHFSRDQLVKPPLGVLWYGDSEDIGFKKRKDYHAGVKPQVVKGVLVAFEELEKYLRAYDVYTGRVLWQHPADPFTRFASMPDGVYAAGSNEVTVRDVYGGEKLNRFPYNAGDDTPDAELFVTDIRVGEDIIVVAADFEKTRRIPEGFFDGVVTVALDRSTGKQLWTRRANKRFNKHGLALGSNLVFLTDSPSAAELGKLKRRGTPPETTQTTLLALDTRTGRITWQETLDIPFLSYHHQSYPQGRIQGMDDALFYSAACDVLIWQKNRNYRGFKGDTGEPLWEISGLGSQPIMLRDEVFYTQSGRAFDVLTGENIPEKSIRAPGAHGCNHTVAGEHLLFRRRFTVAYFDIKSGEAHYTRNVRSGCTISLIAADGVLSSPCFSAGCVCNHPMETTFSLVHMPVAEGWAGGEPVREPMPWDIRDPEEWRKYLATQ